MNEQNDNQEPQQGTEQPEASAEKQKPAEEEKKAPKTITRKRITTLLCFCLLLAALFATGWFVLPFLIAKMGGIDWASDKMLSIAKYLVLGMALGAVPVWLILRKKRKRVKIPFWSLYALVLLVAAGILCRQVLIPIIPRTAEGGIDWGSNEMIGAYIAMGVIIIAVVVLPILSKMKVLRTRLRLKRTLKDDPDVHDYLIIFNWGPKILYVPTIIASFLASILMFSIENNWWIFGSISPTLVGGIWFAIVLANFLIEEFDITIKLLIITVIGVGFFLLWLHLFHKVMDFLRLFRHLAMTISGTGYLLVGIIGVLTILFSWLRGLFYYMAVTPNFINLQEGPTETGRHIGREDYNSQVDTSDFLERLMGFGKIIITFKAKDRQPLTFLVWKIKRKAKKLEEVRAKFAIDLRDSVRA